MKLLPSASSALNAESLSNLAAHLELEPEHLPELISETLTTLFTIFRNCSLEPSKAAQISELLAGSDANLLSEPNSALAEQGATLTRAGKSNLAKLLGPQLTDYIAPLAKASGVGEGKIASVLGTLTPFVLAFLGQETKDANELQQLLSQEEIATPVPESKVTAKTEAPQKSYLPDPAKKKDKRPFPKRKALFLVIILALVAALLFWLVSSGVIPVPDTNAPEGLPIDPELTPGNETTVSTETTS